MTDQKLEDKITEIDRKMYGIAEIVKSTSGGAYDICSTEHIEDICYVEAGKYQIAVAKWEQHRWSSNGGGIEWNEWISVYFHEINSFAGISEIRTKAITTRDLNSPYKDKKEYLPFNHVSITSVKENKIKMFWHDKEKKNGIEYEFILPKLIEL